MHSTYRTQHVELGQPVSLDLESIERRLEKILSRRIDVLEDGPSSKRAYTKIFSDGLGWQLKFLNSKHDVLTSAEEGMAQIYILDNRIGSNATEGLEALQELSHRQSEILIAVCSSYPRYRSNAYSICPSLVAYFDKGTGSDLDASICGLASQFIERISLEYVVIQQSINLLRDVEQSFLSSVVFHAQRALKMEKEKLEKLSNQLSNKNDYEHEERIADKNVSEFDQLKIDAEWLQSYNNRYVAFVDGKQVFEHVKDENELRTLTRQKYPDKRRFITKVHYDGDVKIIKQPSGLTRMIRVKS
jgi:hypothetical protein